jgi:hypothetical protein
MSYHISRSDFDSLVEKAVENLPEEFNPNNAVQRGKPAELSQSRHFL